MLLNCPYPTCAEIAAPTSANLNKAAAYLSQGDLVAIPTETVYGLAADGTNDHAIAKIYTFKNRPTFNPLIFHFADIEAIKEHVHWNECADKLAQDFWPGSLTLILAKRSDSNLSLLATAGLDTVGVRIPQHKIARQLIQKFGKPLAAPSANPSESISPTSAQDVQQSFGLTSSLFILDGGACSVGLESTILDLTDLHQPTLLRPGVITDQALRHCLNCVPMASIHAPDQTAIKAPGQMHRHYAPRLPLRLNATQVSDQEALLAFGSAPLKGAKKTLNLSQNQNLKQAAANLFAMMRQLDRPEYQSIAVMPVPHHGIGLAINDRLERAACS